MGRADRVGGSLSVMMTHPCYWITNQISDQRMSCNQELSKLDVAVVVRVEISEGERHCV